MMAASEKYTASFSVAFLYLPSMGEIAKSDESMINSIQINYNTKIRILTQT